jgi:hypothetical protein
MKYVLACLAALAASPSNAWVIMFTESTYETDHHLITVTFSSGLDYPTKQFCERVLAETVGDYRLLLEDKKA